MNSICIENLVNKHHFNVFHLEVFVTNNYILFNRMMLYILVIETPTSRVCCHKVHMLYLQVYKSHTERQSSLQGCISLCSRIVHSDKCGICHSAQSRPGVHRLLFQCSWASYRRVPVGSGLETHTRSARGGRVVFYPPSRLDNEPQRQDADCNTWCGTDSRVYSRWHGYHSTNLYNLGIECSMVYSELPGTGCECSHLKR